MLNYKCYIKDHGKFQVELKVRYPVKKRRNKYALDLYIFSPKVLSVNRKSYGITAFLKDLRIMTRISTPEIPLPRLFSDDCTESPLYRIKRELDKTSTGGKIHENKIVYELRTLASIIRVELRKNRLFVKKKLDNDTDVEFLSGWLLEFIQQLDVFIEHFRSLKTLFVNPEIDDRLNLAYDWTDESISLNIQREAGIMYRMCMNTPETESSCRGLGAIIDREIRHRIEKNYVTGIERPEKNSTGELLIYRENILKKWSQSAMYLNVTGSRSPARAGQIIAGTAAAAAMTFAVIATMVTNRYFPANSAAWALAAVVAYIFKDRIKEILRSGLKTFLPKKIPDQMSVLRDSSVQRRCGYTKSFVKFTDEDNIPEEIRKARSLKGTPFRELLPGENVIRYCHEVVLDGRRFFENHQRMESVTEILRLELHKFIQLMDDPDQIYYYTNDKQLKKKRLRRVYHLNLVTVLTDLSDGSKKFLKYRIILNRDGIVRIEKPESIN